MNGVPPDDAPTLAALAERDYHAWIEAFDGTPGVEVVIRDEIRYRRSKVAHPYLNHAYRARLRPEAVARCIEHVVAVLGRGGRSFTWTVWPSDEPRDLATRLVGAGFEDLGSGPLMGVELGDWPGPGPTPAGLRIRRVEDPGDIGAVDRFVASSMEGDLASVEPFAATFRRLILEPEPRVVLFEGRIDGEIVAAAALFTGSGVAGIYGVVTAERARGRGYGGALTAAAMQEGRRRGMTAAVLLASELGEPVYRRLGFRDVGQVRFLHWPGVPG